MEKIFFFTSMLFLTLISCSKQDESSIHNYQFSEEEAIFNGEIANKLGYTYIITEKGNYELSFDDNEFGTVKLRIKEYGASIASIKAPSVTFRFWLGKRENKCGTYCACGWGFRCGGGSPSIEPPLNDLNKRYLQSEVSIVNDELNIAFLEAVDYNYLVSTN